MIEVRGLDAWYGHARVLRDVTFTVEAGTSVAILGRNGMGKTSILRCLVGMESPLWTGSIRHSGVPVRPGFPHAVVARGYGYVPEGRGLFRTLTVAENLRVARRAVPSPKWPRERIFELFPVLQERAGQIAGTLSGGQQQMLAIGRALANEPSVLVLDEPSLGLAPAVIGTLEQSLRDIAGSGVTMIIVEQHLSFALNLSERVLVIEKGSIVREFGAAELRADPERVRSLLTLGQAAAG
ncbi:MAG: ABC transporter ATP-binding protein [Lautropia sp.]